MADCHCGRPATHKITDGRVTLMTCYIHARKAALKLRNGGTR